MLNNSISRYLVTWTKTALCALVCLCTITCLHATEESDYQEDTVEPTYKNFDLACCNQYCDNFPPEQRKSICKNRCWQPQVGGQCYVKYDKTEDCERTFNSDCRAFCEKSSKDPNMANDALFQELLQFSTIKTCRDPKKSTYQAGLDTAENAKIAACKTTLSIDCLNQLDRCRKSPEDTYCKDVAGAAGTGWVAAKPAVEAKIKELITACLVDLKDPLCLEITKKCVENKGLYEYCDREWNGAGFMAVANKQEQVAAAGSNVEKALEEANKAREQIDATPQQ